MTEWLAGAALGAAGSVHCAVMCGPLSLAVRGGLRVAGRGPASSWMLLALYHGGRLSAYAAAGLAVGGLGQALAVVATGRGLAIAAGSVLLLQAAARLGLERAAPAFPARVLGRLGAASRRLFESHPWVAALSAGALNAALPCGLVYAALTAAAAQARADAGLIFMLGFGAGTVPVLAAVWLMGALAAPSGRRLVYAAPVALAVVGGLLIARGTFAHHSAAGAGARPDTHAHSPRTPP